MAIDQADRDALLNEALPQANFEQAVRWIAYGLPPLRSNLEELYNYPSIIVEREIDGDFISKKVNEFKSHKIIQGALRELLLALARAKIVMRARLYKAPDENEYDDGQHEGPIPYDLLSDDIIVPEDVWSVSSLSLNHNTICISDRPDFDTCAVVVKDGAQDFRHLRILFVELADAFPRDEALVSKSSPEQENPKGVPLHQTTLLKILDELRQEIGSDGNWFGNPPKRDALKSEILHRHRTLSDREADAIATCLLPDEVRRKSR